MVLPFSSAVWVLMLPSRRCSEMMMSPFSSAVRAPCSQMATLLARRCRRLCCSWVSQVLEMLVSPFSSVLVSCV